MFLFDYNTYLLCLLVHNIFTVSIYGRTCLTPTTLQIKLLIYRDITIIRRRSICFPSF